MSLHNERLGKDYMTQARTTNWLIILQLLLILPSTVWENKGRGRNREREGWRDCVVEK